MSQPAPTPSSPGLRLADAWPRFVHIYQKEIWQSALLKSRSLKGICYAVLRVVSITITVFVETRLASRAAALSFSSLLGLGPLLAIATLIAGFALGAKDSKEIARAISEMVTTVAPQLQAYDQQSLADLNQKKAEWEWLHQMPYVPEPNQTFVDVINRIIGATRSGSAGTLAPLSLLFIVLLLFKSIEDTFNDIWGVRQGRSILTRIVFYWTVLTLGAVLFLTAIASMSAGTVVTMFRELLPKSFNELLNSDLSWLLPLLSFGFSFTLLTCVLSLFYRVIPNTRVFWRAALIGGLVVTTLLMLNQFLTFLYVKRIFLERSLYGSLALPLVVMSSLYIFWLCVLTGGIVSYAIQNVHFRNSQAAWSTLTENMRERLALVVFLTVCRRFRECLPPVSASHLSAMLKVPTQLLNECLNRLVQIKLIATVRPDPSATAADYLYQPAKPLNRLTLLDFKMLDDNFGENPIGASLERIDPLLAQYDAALNRISEQEFFQKTVEQLFDEHPFDESRPPFAMGERRPAR